MLKYMKPHGKIPSITNLATTTSLTAIENKIPNVSNLVKKLIITQKLVKLKKELLIMIMVNIITPEFFKLIAQNFVARLGQTNSASKSDIAALVKKTDFNDKLKNLNKKVTSIK